MNLGARIFFDLEGHDAKIEVFTTRPDTLFGATYMVLAPEHPLVPSLTTADHEDELKAYLKQAALKSDLDRTELAKEKTGVFSGSYAVNPVNDQAIPIWIADYVLMGYGTGAIMAVPAHDTRDFEFAQTFNLPIICIMEPQTDDSDLKAQVLAGTACWPEDGHYIRSSNPNGGLDINCLNKKDGIICGFDADSLCDDNYLVEIEYMGHKDDSSFIFIDIFRCAKKINLPLTNKNIFSSHTPY